MPRQFHKFSQYVGIAFLASVIIACAPPPVPTVVPTVAPTLITTPTVVRTPIASPTVVRTPTLAPTAIPSAVKNIAPDLIGRRVPLTLAINRFSPSALTARVGQPIRLNLYNSDSLLHEFAIDDSEVVAVVEPRASQNADFVINKAGTYTFACNLILEGDHRSLGMVGTIVVELSQ